MSRFISAESSWCGQKCLCLLLIRKGKTLPREKSWVFGALFIGFMSAAEVKKNKHKSTRASPLLLVTSVAVLPLFVPKVFCSYISYIQGHSFCLSDVVSFQHSICVWWMIPHPGFQMNINTFFSWGGYPKLNIAFGASRKQLFNYSWMVNRSELRRKENHRIEVRLGTSSLPHYLQGFGTIPNGGWPPNVDFWIHPEITPEAWSCGLAGGSGRTLRRASPRRGRLEM